MSINCEILDLRAFLLVSETRSFHRAAEILHVSQPALSRSIARIEDQLGAVLFERAGDGAKPTSGHGCRNRSSSSATNSTTSPCL